MVGLFIEKKFKTTLIHSNHIESKRIMTLIMNEIKIQNLSKIAQFFSGINAVTFYSTKIFYNAGLKGEWPTYSTILLGIVQVTMTLVCMVLIEKTGRRSLLLTSCMGMSFFSFSLAVSRIYGSPEREWYFRRRMIR